MAGKEQKQPGTVYSREGIAYRRRIGAWKEGTAPQLCMRMAQNTQPCAGSTGPWWREESKQSGEENNKGPH